MSEQPKPMIVGFEIADLMAELDAMAVDVKPKRRGEYKAKLERLRHRVQDLIGIKSSEIEQDVMRAAIAPTED